jgi:hypothetical protein
VKWDEKYLIFLGKEQYSKGMFKLMKRWDKYLNANGDHVEK